MITSRFSSPWLATALGTAGLLVLGQGLSSYGAGLVIDCLVFAILALGLNLLLGYAGLPSLGHAAYFGVGAYTAGLVYLHVSTNFWLAAAAAIVAAMAVAAVYALLALRTTGVYFLIITLALGQITWAAAFSWRSVTGATTGCAASAGRTWACRACPSPTPAATTCWSSWPPPRRSA